MLCCSVSDFDFSGPYWRKEGRGRHAAPKGLGPQNLTRKLAHLVELLVQQLYQKKVFGNLGPEIFGRPSQ